MLCLKLLQLFILSNAALSQEDGIQDPIITTLSGKVSGVRSETPAGNLFYRFLGIPYAETPTEKLRFRDPVPKMPWNDVLNATEFPEMCLQKSYNEDFSVYISGSEDCLYLNIYTPSLPKPGYQVPKSLKPVMFWIHGGGFIEGDGNLDPTLLLDEDVVFVSVHYRLGPFGFFSLENNPDLAGNMGLKDQQEALKWVNRNIIYFGGDPMKVTLFGESAGSISVHAHTLSPRIRNIFQGAILQSGTALMRYRPTFVDKEPQRNCKDFLEKLECKLENALECLQGKDAESLLEYSPEEVPGFDLTKYWLVQDSASASPLLPYNPLQQLVSGNVKKVPIIVGITKDDGALNILSDPNVKKSHEDDNSTLLTLSLGLASTDVSEKDVSVVDLLKRFYLTNDSYEDNEKNYLEMFTDGWFGSPASQVAKHHSNVAPVFPYILNERCTQFSFSVYYGGAVDKDYGVAHADDINCIFQPYPTFDRFTEPGNLTSQTMIKSWTNFAKFENPSPYLSSEPTWPTGEIMFFQSKSGVDTNKSQLMDTTARAMLWEKLFWRDLEDDVKVPASRQPGSFLTFMRPYTWVFQNMANSI